MPKLLALLKTDKVSLASAVATALMTITIAIEGKYAVVETEGGLKVLGTWLNPQREQLCVNIMEVISNVAEAPDSRPVLAECGVLARLVDIHSNAASEMLKRSAAQALRQCKFHHWPYEPLPGKQVRMPAEDV